MMHSSLPTISVIVPSKDRPDGIARLLDNVQRQDYPQELIEIVIVDDGSTPPYRFDGPGVHVIRHDTAQGAQASRNEALRVATGELALMSDDDVELVGKDFFRRSVEVLAAQPNVAAVFGRKIDVHNNGGASYQFDFSTSRPTLYSGDLVPARDKAGPIAWGHMVYFVRRRLLLDLGGYDGIYGLNGGHSFREESDIQARLRAQGHQIWFLPDVAIKHHVVSTGGHGASVGKRLYWIAHNHMIFLRRHLRCWPCRAVGFVLDIARYSWVQGRFRYMGPMIKGYLAGWRNALRDHGPGQNPWLKAH